MPRRLSPEHQLELERLYRILRVLAEFLDQLMPAIAPTAADTIRCAYEERDLRGLRAARTDFVAMARVASAAQRRELDQQLRARSAVSLDELSERELRRIGQIRTRGKITSDEQYYLISERIEFIAGDSAREDEYTELLRLLGSFEERSCQTSSE
jgi:hypothetical protein